MKAKRVLPLVLAFVAVPSIVYLAANPQARTKAHGAFQLRVLGASPAYTVYLEDRAVCNAEGKLGEVFNKRVYARRSDGCKVFVNELVGVEPRRTRRLHMADGTRALVEDSAGIKTTWRRESTLDRELNERDPASDCVNTHRGRRASVMEFAGYDGEVLGYKVVKFVDETPGRRWTLWRAPNLGCEILKNLVERGTPLKVASSVEGVKVLVGEPPDHLFAVPDYYHEASPSEARVLREKHRRARQGQELTPEQEQALRAELREKYKRQDEGYYARRP